MARKIPKEFALKTLGEETFARLNELNAKKNLVSSLNEEEKIEYKMYLNELVEARKGLQSPEDVPLGELRYALELSDPDMAADIGNKILEQSGYPGKVIKLDKGYGIQDDINGDVFAINPKGIDGSDLKMLQAKATEALPIVGGVGGLLLGPAGAGAGGIAGGMIEQTARENLESKYLNKDFNLADVAGAGVEEAGYNALGLGLGRLAGGAGKFIPETVKRSVGEGVEKLAKPVVEAADPVLKALGNAQKEVQESGVGRAINEGLDKVRETTLGATALGTDRIFKNSVKTGFEEGLTRGEIEARMKAEPELYDMNAKQAREVQEAQKPVMDQQEVLEELVFSGDPNATGRRVQEQTAKVWQEGLQAERAGFNNAIEIAKGERSSTRINVANLMDQVLDTSDETMSPAVKETFKKYNGRQHLAPGEALELGRDLNSLLRKGSYNSSGAEKPLTDSEYAIIAKVKGQLISDPDSLFRQFAPESPALQKYVDTSADRVARNDAIQEKIFDKVLGKGTDLSTGQVPRFAKSEREAFEGVANLKANDPTDYGRYKEYTGFDESLDEDMALSRAKDLYERNTQNTVTESNNLAKQKMSTAMRNDPVVAGTDLGDQVTKDLSDVEIANQKFRDANYIENQALDAASRGAPIRSLPDGVYKTAISMPKKVLNEALLSGDPVSGLAPLAARTYRDSEELLNQDTSFTGGKAIDGLKNEVDVIPPKKLKGGVSFSHFLGAS